MVQVVWFKRDLRSVDHAPLAEAARGGPVVPLYVVEPPYWALPDTSRRQWRAVRGALEELRDRLGALGTPLVVRTGEVCEIFDRLHRLVGIDRILAHEETGNAWTFARDREVRAWCRRRGVPLVEVPQFGVVRALRDRDDWGRRHAGFMNGATVPEPDTLSGPRISPGPIPMADELGLTDDGCNAPQPGTRAEGLGQLAGFLGGRGADYRRSMSSPASAAEACSRLSVPLATGVVSVREVLRRVLAERDRLWRAPRELRPVPLTAIDSLVARLHWHCHFIQKLECEPAIEWQAMHPMHRSAGPADAAHEAALGAWAQGRTGLPFVDACMRSLIATGWLNFRMRAMVTAVASYHLGLDWRASGNRLARLFTDYEPGIHWPQVQMQSRVTGINTPRIYNPVKQGLDQDPDGSFTRRWIPELANVPAAFLQEPYRMDADLQSHCGCVIGRHYPAPIVEPAEAARAARERLATVRRQPGYGRAAQEVYRRHGSRKRRPGDDDPARSRAIAVARARAAARQLTLDL